MKKIFILPFMLLMINQLIGQIGISAAYKNFNAQDWFTAPSQSAEISPYSGYNVGMNYWFRLKNQRVEFLPELSYGNNEGDLGEGELSVQFLNFQLNTNIYLLDFNNDCNCPTFDKGGNFFTKGFFIQLAPGVSRISLETRLESQEPDLPSEDELTAFNFGVGVGVDFGISKLITLTPLVRYHFYPEVESEIIASNIDQKTTIKQLYMGLHMGIRWNDGSNAGSRRRGRSLSGRRR